jgi:hypothetical protein
MRDGRKSFLRAQWPIAIAPRKTTSSRALRRWLDDCISERSLDIPPKDWLPSEHLRPFARTHEVT